MAWWLSWLERRPVTAEVVGSNPIRVVFNLILYIWDHSSAGRASALQAEGHRFEPYWSHLCRHGSMAEQLICNQQVVGSTPTVGFRGGLSTDMKMGYCVLIEYGRIPEWPKGTDCKSAGDAFEGSNPSPSIVFNTCNIKLLGI